MGFRPITVCVLFAVAVRDLRRRPRVQAMRTRARWLPGSGPRKARRAQLGDRQLSEAALRLSLRLHTPEPLESGRLQAVDVVPPFHRGSGSGGTLDS